MTNLRISVIIKSIITYTEEVRMINFLMFSGIAILFLGLPISVIVTIVFAIKKKRVLIPAICIPTSLLIGLIFICVGGYLYSQTDEYKQSAVEMEQVEPEKKEEEKQEDIVEESKSEEKANNDSKDKENKKETEEKKDTKKEEPKDKFTYKNTTLEYKKHEVMVDEIDQTVLVVYYDFTNNSGENKTFDYVFEDTCFQNGVEVEASWWHVNDESHNSGKEIKTGTTITVASAFVLGESMDDVELEITPWLGGKVLFEKTLKIK